MRKDISIAKVPWGVRDVLKMFLATFIIPFAIFAVLVGLSHFGLLPQMIRETLKSNDFVVNIGFELLVIAVEASMVIWLIRKYHLRLGDLGMRRFSIWKALLYIVLGLILFSVFVAGVFVLITVLVPSVDVNQAQDTGFEFGHKGAGLAISFVATVIVAPILEEVYFRGLILPALAKRYGWLFGVLVSSGLFAVLHMQVNVIIYTFLLGLVLSFFYIRLKSIIPGIFLHMINNLLAFVVLAGLVK